MLQALIAHGPMPQLFCVGDDWQAIYRFAGGDMEIMTDFERWFGPTQQIHLDCCFRYHNKIEEVSSGFVQQNPRQLRKQINTTTLQERPGITLWAESWEQAKSGVILQQALDEIEASVSPDQENVEVLILSRKAYLLKKIRPRVSPRITAKKMTIHKSKGLTTDFVILLGFTQGVLPSTKKEDKYITWVLPGIGEFPHAEERRILYVALTRAKQHVYILGDPSKRSVFVNELIGDHDIIHNFRPPGPQCKKCGQGEVVLRIGQYGEYFPCSNRSCGYKAAKHSAEAVLARDAAES